jgi:DNA gyrase subunit A
MIADEGEFSIEDLIAEEDMVVTISHSGYIKRTPVTTYRKQRRGGRGLSGSRSRRPTSSRGCSSRARTTTS